MTRARDLSNLLGTAISESSGDTRYVNASGDTMTAASRNTDVLQIAATGAATSYGLRIGADGSTDPLEIWRGHANGNQKQFGVDYYGRVTMPYQPSANVFLRSGDQGAYNNNGNVEMIATGVRHNVGNHYSTSTGRFTCPVNGIYYVAFSDNFYNSGASTYWMPNIRKNGSIIKQAYNNVPSGGTWQHISASVTVECSAGDYLSIYQYSQGGGAGGDLNEYSANIFYLIG